MKETESILGSRQGQHDKFKLQKKVVIQEPDDENRELIEQHQKQEKMQLFKDLFRHRVE